MLIQSFNLIDIFNKADWKTASLKEIIGTTKNDAFKSEMNQAGVYVFWWSGTLDELGKLHRKVEIQGKVIDATKKKAHEKHHMHQLTFQTEWLTPIQLKQQDQAFYALYVGKSTNVLNRFGLHLKNGTNHEDWRDIMLYDETHNPDKSYHSNKFYKLDKPTTSCQFRAGFELLCLDMTTNEEFNDCLKNKVHFSFLPLDNDDKDVHVANRFYLEDYLIGALRPWFNLDSER